MMETGTSSLPVFPVLPLPCCLCPAKTNIVTAPTNMEAFRTADKHSGNPGDGQRGGAKAEVLWLVHIYFWVLVDV